MKFYVSGQKESSVIMLFPGTCCHWKAGFSHVVPCFEEDFRVVCVSYDGFCENGDTVFANMIVETENIARPCLL